MAWVYILQNREGSHYIGITDFNAEKRVAEHNKGKAKSTKFLRPWTLIHKEYYQTLQLARNREKQIKSWKEGNSFKKLLHKSPGSSNGRTSGSGPDYLGSNPSPGDL